MIRDELLEMYRDIKQMHEQMQSLLAVVKTEANFMDPSFIVDATYVLKRANEFVDGTRKDVNKSLEYLQKLGCMLVMQQSENKLTGNIANGYCTTRENHIPPTREKNPEEYHSFMAAIGVPEELASSGLIKPSVTGVADLVSQLAEQGKPLPPGLKPAIVLSSYTITAKARAGVDLDALAEKVLAPLFGELES